MGLYTRITRDWLERRFSTRSDSGVYLAHMPIYGVGESDCEDNHLGRLGRLLRILRRLDGLEFETLLDVGGAEGYLPYLVREILGAGAVSTDLSHEACQRAGELFGIGAAAADCHQLPFADDAFDVVVCSEVIEHVEHAVETMLELQRVARRAVILTTEEVHFDRAWIDNYLFRRPGWPHMERNLFHPDDLLACFPDADVEPQTDEAPSRSAPTREQARAWLLNHTKSVEPARGRLGIVLTQILDPAARRERLHDDESLLDRLLDTTIPRNATANDRVSLEDLLPCLRDPETRAPLRRYENAVGTPDGARYPVRAGIADFVAVDRLPPSRVELDHTLRRLHSDRAAKMLTLRDRLFLPDRWTLDFFDLRQTEHRRGFWPNNQLQRRDGGEGFSWRSTGPDPWVVTPCLQRPIRAVEIELRVQAADNPIESGTGQLFWKGPDDDDFAEARSIKFAVPNDGRAHVHRIELGKHPQLPEEVQWMRIDPIDGECDLDFLSLRLI